MTLFKKLTNNRVAVFITVLIIAGLLSFTASYFVRNNKSTANCNGTCVDIYEDKATPDTVAVTAGSYVQFNSKDGKTHDLSLGAGGSEHQHKGKFQSGDFGANEAWRVQFKDEGTFTFHDHLNPKVSILVVVYTKDKQYKVE